MKTLETLKEEKTKLVNLLRIGATGEDEIFEQIRNIEDQIKQQKRIELINKVNTEQASKREHAHAVWNCEEVNEDITTENGSFHKTKVKKYPLLASLQYVRAKFKNGRLLEITYQGETFKMYHTASEYNKPDQYTRPESFAAFLELNRIMGKDITPEEFNSNAQEIEEAKKDIEKQIEDYKARLKAIDIHNLEEWGMITTSPNHLRTYATK
jgi:hypothetical protein